MCVNSYSCLEVKSLRWTLQFFLGLVNYIIGNAFTCLRMVRPLAPNTDPKPYSRAKTYLKLYLYIMEIHSAIASQPDDTDIQGDVCEFGDQEGPGLYGERKNCRLCSTQDGKKDVKTQHHPCIECKWPVCKNHIAISVNTCKKCYRKSFLRKQLEDTS